MTTKGSTGDRIKLADAHLVSPFRVKLPLVIRLSSDEPKHWGRVVWMERAQHGRDQLRANEELLPCYAALPPTMQQQYQDVDKPEECKPEALLAIEIEAQGPSQE